MARDFAAGLRARPGVLRLGTSTAPLALRVQMPEVWDVVRIDADPDVSVAAVKEAAMAELNPGSALADELVMKLNGIEILDEGQSVAATGARSGSTFLMTFRRRRAVR